MSTISLGAQLLFLALNTVGYCQARLPARTRMSSTGCRKDIGRHTIERGNSMA